MKTFSSLIPAGLSILGAANAAILSIDFEGDNNGATAPNPSTQSGFQSFDLTNLTSATGPNSAVYSGLTGVGASNSLTVTVAAANNGGRTRIDAFAAGSNVALPDLLRDGVVGFQSGSPALPNPQIPINPGKNVLTISGLALSTSYNIRIWSYGHGVDNGGATNGNIYTWFDNTTGSPISIGSIINNQITASSTVGINDYSVFAQVTSDATGTLKFGFSSTTQGNLTDAAGSGALNGLEITAVPEPATLGLFSIALTGGFFFRRRNSN